MDWDGLPDSYMEKIQEAHTKRNCTGIDSHGYKVEDRTQASRQKHVDFTDTSPDSSIQCQIENALGVFSILVNRHIVTNTRQFKRYNDLDAVSPYSGYILRHNPSPPRL